jgi:3-oxoacyl-[acyl-carrier protein] reductase
MNSDLTGKRAVITGGSKGIGRCIALALAREGVQIATCARDPGPLGSLRAEIEAFGGKASVQAIDVTDGAKLDAFLDEARDTMGGIDILINNASALSTANSEEGWNSNIRVDLMSAVRASERVIPWMRDTGSGNVIFISSVSGMESGGTSTAYSAIKAAMISYAKSLSVHHAASGIRVNTIAPGAIEYAGGIWERRRAEQPELYERFRKKVPWGRMGRPEEVANVAVFLASNMSDFVTGVCIPVDGGKHKANF